MAITHFPFSWKILMSSCADFVLLEDRRGGKKNKIKEMGFAMNGIHKCFVNLCSSLQAHSQIGHYGTAHMWNFKVSL